MASFFFAFWILMAAGLLGLLATAAIGNFRRRNSPPIGPGSVIPKLLPVDLDVLSVFVEPSSLPASRAESLSPGVLSPRERARKTRECLRRMAGNAALLQQIGYTHVQSENQLIASLAQEMIDAGVSVRLYAFVCMAKLRLSSMVGAISMFVAIPKIHALSSVTAPDLGNLFSTGLLPAYELLKLKAGNLTALKYSDFADALAQGL